MRLNIAVGHGGALRAGPDSARSNWSTSAATREVYGFRGLVQGHARSMANRRMKTVDRRAYAEMYGPTTGDRVRLADTELVIEVETTTCDRGYGEEVKFGGGKTIRDGMGQSQRVARRGAPTR